MKETDEQDDCGFHLMVGFASEVNRGMYQFGAIINGEFYTLVYGSVSELGDGYFLNGIIENLRLRGIMGEFFVLTSEEDKDFFIGDNEDFLKLN